MSRPFQGLTGSLHVKVRRELEEELERCLKEERARRPSRAVTLSDIVRDLLCEALTRRQSSISKSHVRELLEESGDCPQCRSDDKIYLRPANLSGSGTYGCNRCGVAWSVVTTEGKPDAP